MSSTTHIHTKLATVVGPFCCCRRTGTTPLACRQGIAQGYLGWTRVSHYRLLTLLRFHLHHRRRLLQRITRHILLNNNNNHCNDNHTSSKQCITAAACRRLLVDLWSDLVPAARQIQAAPPDDDVSVVGNQVGHRVRRVGPAITATISIKREPKESSAGLVECLIIAAPNGIARRGETLRACSR